MAAKQVEPQDCGGIGDAASLRSSCRCRALLLLLLLLLSFRSAACLPRITALLWQLPAPALLRRARLSRQPVQMLQLRIRLCSKAAAELPPPAAGRLSLYPVRLRQQPRSSASNKSQSKQQEQQQQRRKQQRCSLLASLAPVVGAATVTLLGLVAAAAGEANDG